ncbi:hypothetical protein LRP49_15615 [Enterovibrio sp. ZSDZ35]|uniref:Uncharacterized protein n=1 Tax=Enterovibrio qingdaonensis TaxID=2899818 RepID=A0ABT5QNN5_9GAMM|nr:hypothetical protein [Enterovibrio sp. ZSDZ35]MDD1782600.1 hypothetical protein [Enterovibrio sp. ZSDZ35]
MDIWALLLLGGGALFYFFVLYSKPQDEDWKKLPTLEEYLAANPECRVEDPQLAKCRHCGSEKIVFQTLTGVASDPRFKYICVSCKKVLYRDKSLMS